MKLIEKDALVAKIEKHYNECLKRAKVIDSDYWNAKADAYRNVLVILDDTLEVKGADIENAAITEWNDYIKKIDGEPDAAYMLIKRNDYIALAKHFFELELKSQK